MSSLLRRILPTLLVLAFPLSSAACAGPADRPSYDESQTIWIGGWVAPPPGFITSENYQAIADSGINVIYGLYEGPTENGGLLALDLASEHGIRYLMYDRRLGSLPIEEAARVAKYIEEYKDHPALAGNLIADEPGPLRFETLAAIATEYRKAAPTKVAYINLFPTYASLAQRDGRVYPDYLSEFLDQFDLGFLSYDHYPLLVDGEGNESVREDFFLNLEYVAKAAQEAGIPFWNFIQTTGWGSTVRDPSEADIRWQVYSTLLFGGKGIQYFCYWTPTSGSNETFDPCMITADGQKTRHYYEVQTVNREILAIDHILLSMEWKGTMVHPADGKAAPAFTFQKEPLASWEPIARITGDAVAIGCLQDAEGNRAVIVLNLSTAEAAEAKLEFKGVRTVDMWTKGEAEEIKGSTITVSLDAGEGKLLQLYR